MEYMREFLKKEDRESFDNFWENSQKLVWIDWREYDEDIINYIEGVIQSGELSGKSKDVDNEMGFDIFIEWKGKEYKISYPNKFLAVFPKIIKTFSIFIF